MNEEILTLLAEPFPKELIKTRPGPGNRSFAFVEVAEYVRRLNQAFSGNWSFHIASHELHGDEVIVLGRLEAGEITKCAFGGATRMISRETGEVQGCLADTMKSAASDSLKRCARLFSVGLSLYDEPVASVSNNNCNASRRTTDNGNGSNSGNGGGNGHAKATIKQVGAVWALSRRLGLSSEAIQTRCLADYGTKVEALSKSDASNLIEQLGAEVNGG